LRIMTKRKRFLITSIVLSLGFVVVQLLEGQLRIIGIFILGLCAIATFFWSLAEGLGKNMTLLTLVLPFFYTVGVGLFWFLLPVSLFTRIPIVVFYGLGIYSLCLTLNIYTVAAIRTIALLRAARGVGFLLTLVTFFLIYDAIISLRTEIFINSLLLFLSSILLFFQAFWSATLERELSFKLFGLSLTTSIIVGEIALALYFWPVTVIVGSLFLTVSVYILLGLGQAMLDSRLFSRTVMEYLTVGIIVFLGMLFSTRWGG